ncbi:MAG TPA: MFS transporter [Pseudonocardiaceae bacterium]
MSVPGGRPPRALPAGWVVFAIVVLALNLRPPFTGPGALLPAISADLGLTGVEAGLLTTLPVACLGVFGVLAPVLRRRWGDEGAVLLALPLLLVGDLLRLGPDRLTLFAGTVLVGAGIGIVSVALPGLIKREFPRHVTLVTSLYTTCLTLGAAAAAAVVVPVQHAAGGSWRVPLGALVPLALVASLAWLPAVRSVHRPEDPSGPSVVLRRSPLAWQVTGFMGLQSLLAYVTFGYLATIGQFRGLADTEAGVLLSVSSLVQAAGSLFLPVMARGRRDQRWLTVLTTSLVVTGYVGVVLAPLGQIWFWAVVLGFGQGAGFGLALSLIGLRAGDAAIAARLSSMAQGIGYVVAATGPLVVGVLSEISGGWTVPLVVLLGVAAVQLACGLGAGRAVRIGAVVERQPAREHVG